MDGQAERGKLLGREREPSPRPPRRVLSSGRIITYLRRSDNLAHLHASALLFLFLFAPPDPPLSWRLGPPAATPLDSFPSFRVRPARSLAVGRVGGRPSGFRDRPCIRGDLHCVCCTIFVVFYLVLIPQG